MKKSLLSLTLGPALLFSSTDTIDNLFDLDLQQLQDITVITATKTKTKIKETPATVRVITSQMIEERGYLSLEEALADLPGMQFRDIQGFNSYTFMRGAVSQNNLLLVMVDGIVINELNSGGFYGGLHYNLANISRIEVMYGPGSALYGTNALSGIINIITKEPDHAVQGLTASMTSGSFDALYMDMAFSRYDSKTNSGYRMTAMYKTTSKTDLAGAAGSYNWSSDMENFEEDLSVEGKFSFENLHLGMTLQDKKASRTTNYTSTGTDYYDQGSLWHIFFANLWAKHTYAIDEKKELHTQFYYRNSTVADDTVAYVTNGATDNNQTGYYRPNDLFGVEERFIYTGVDDLRLTVGAVFEKEKLSDGFSKSYSNSYLVTPPAPQTPDMIQNSLYGIYGQAEFRFAHNLALTAGVRHEESTLYGSVNTPRSSLVYSKGDSVAKLIYAEAFRAPKPWDYSYGSGNSALLPEKMKSYEFFWGQSITKKVQADITFFSNRIDHKLTLDSTNNRWVNQGDLYSRGIETSLFYRSPKATAYFNITYTSSEDETGNPSDEIASYTANTGCTYKPSKIYTAHLGINYVGSRLNPAQPGSKTDPYTVANASISYNGIKSWKFDLMIKNLFDEVYSHPSNRPPSEYRQAERGLYLRANYRLR